MHPSYNNKTMKTKTTMNVNGSIAIGGGVLLGVGVGFFLLPMNALYFVGSIVSGLGLGMIIAALVAKERVIQGKEES
jgi:hypothetical protein